MEQGMSQKRMSQMGTRFSGWLVASGLALALNAGAAAQTRGDLPPVAPSVTSNSQVSVEPSLKLSISGLPDGFELSRSATFADGTIVTGVPGMLIKTGAGDFVFLPDKGSHISDAPLAPEAPAVVLLPCQRLAQIATSLQSRGDRSRGSLSGQLYSYRGRSFVLPTAVVYEAVTPTKTTQENSDSQSKVNGDSKPEETSTKSAVSSGTNTDAGKVNEVIRDLEMAWSTRRTMSRPDHVANDAGDKDGDAKPVSLVPERTLLSNVRGRLVRLAEASGRFAFAVDNDPNSPVGGVQVPGSNIVARSGNVGATGPMLLLPNRQLEMIEDAVSQMGENAAFSLTARVTEYKGERYVMPIAFRVLASGDIKPAQ